LIDSDQGFKWCGSGRQTGRCKKQERPIDGRGAARSGAGDRCRL